uniref:RING-H2 finger protein ATL74-like n=1 Tax=Erigeron canadensis TaxID=72917 RepID=UPI001CB9D3D5|nr:RING-H2 finger protein ATL74-like [Erigeron canadensis]
MVRFVFVRVDHYPSSGNNTSDDSSHVKDTGFDVNTIVVLAALLCTLIGALALNSIIHYALRRTRALLDPEVTKTEGLKKQNIKKIPVEVIKLRGEEVLAAECSICLGHFVDGEKVRVLPECNHEFHVKCVDQWLLDHMSCPNCRHLVAVPPI